MPAKNRNDLKDPRYLKARRWVLDHNPQCIIPGCATPADTVDHIIPVSRGGDPYSQENLRPAHYGCNSRRGNKTTYISTATTTTRDW